MLRLEAVLLAGFGTALGLVLGGALGWVLFVTVSGSGLFVLLVVPLVVIAVVGAASGALAAFRLSRRAARLPILDAIATTYTHSMDVPRHVGPELFRFSGPRT